MELLSFNDSKKNDLIYCSSLISHFIYILIVRGVFVEYNISSKFLVKVKNKIMLIKSITNMYDFIFFFKKNLFLFNVPGFEDFNLY